MGPMPVTLLNEFLAENESIKLGKGEVDGVEFTQVSKGGRATTTLTPRYRDLKVELSSEGGGVVGSVKRAVVKFAANTFKVREENPEDDGKSFVPRRRSGSTTPRIPGSPSSGSDCATASRK